MKPNFSFEYKENRFSNHATNEETFPHGLSYTLEEGIKIILNAKEYPKYNAIEWVLHFENNSESDSGIFSNINDCDILLPLQFPEGKRNGYMPKEGDACIIAMNGMVDGKYYWENDQMSAAEYRFTREYLDKAKGKTKTFANIGGRSSQGTMPFFDVTASDCGYIVAIGWTGDWKAEFTKCDEGILVKTGLKNTHFYLRPGEKIRTSSVLIMQYADGEDKYNKFRRLIKNHFSHKSNSSAKRESLMAFELWGGLPDEEMKQRIRQLQNYDIRFEDIWIDAGWYGNCEKCDDPFTGDWSKKTGNWTVNPRPHPGELLDVRDEAKDAGMNLMLWFEPERAIKGTPVTEEHPDWFLSVPGSDSFVLNYGNSDAKNYVCKLLSDYIRKLDLSCYRQDFNVDLTKYFEINDEENRRGITEIKHITGMYEVWDHILKTAPHLLIDNCSSGGRRIDIETLKRSIPFFRSDYQCNFNENPEVLQVHNTNISRYLPYQGCTSKTKSDTYAIRSSYSSSWGGAFYNAVFQSMEENDFLWVKKITDEYRRIRKYISMDFYNHGSSQLDETSWTIWQYHDNDTQSGIVMAFRRSESPFDRVTITLKGLADTDYTLTNSDLRQPVFCRNRTGIHAYYRYGRRIHHDR